MSWCYQLEWRWKLSSRRQPHGCLRGVTSPLATIDSALGEKNPDDSLSNDWHPYRAWDLRCRCFNGPGAFRQGLRPLLLRRPPEKPNFGFGRRKIKKRRLVTRPSRYFISRPFFVGGGVFFLKGSLPPSSPPSPPPTPSILGRGPEPMCRAA